MHARRAVTVVGALLALCGCSVPTEPAPAPTALAPWLTTPTGPTDPCPVTAATLQTALVGTELGGHLHDPGHLTVQSCYQGYAMAREGAEGPAERSWVLFGYQRPANTWNPLNIGTADVCATHVPTDDIRRHLGEAC